MDETHKRVILTGRIMIMEIILMVCGVFWIIFSLLNITKNIKSAIFFKVIPFFTGLATIVCAMDLLGWISIFK